jgi:hypothetical protein
VARSHNLIAQIVHGVGELGEHHHLRITTSLKFTQNFGKLEGLAVCRQAIDTIDNVINNRDLFVSKCTALIF